MSPTTLTVEHDGLRIAVLDWGGEGPPLLLAHPNGFCAGVFDPLARRLIDDYRPVGVDLRGHGASDAPASRDACGYGHDAGDLLAALEALGLDEVLALGESLGGAAVILLDHLAPGVVRRAMLCEAIAFAGPARDGRSLEDQGSPLADGARRRRVVWPDRDAVVASYGSRPPLSVLEPDALAAYARYGFRDRPDGQVELACRPEVEAWNFDAGGAPDGGALAFAHLPEMHAPVTIVCGEATDLPAGMFEAQAAAARAALVRVPGTHFFLQEDSDRAAALVREHLHW
jgi:pimeloyl-ACP methyl ester carboxylesterase